MTGQTSSGKGPERSSLAQMRTLARAVKDRQLRLLISVSRVFLSPVYRSAFLTGATSSGLLRELAERPADLATLAARLDLKDEQRRLKVWLDLGVQLGDLKLRGGRYELHSRFAKQLADPANDSVVGALEELTRFHFSVLRDAPEMLHSKRRYSLSDQDGPIIARASMVVRSLVAEAVNRTLDPHAPLRLLEIGCGSGIHVRHAATHNPNLTAVAVDFQDDVAKLAASNLDKWGLSDRIEVRQGDAFKIDLNETFDFVTMHQNIYYFAVDDRVETLKKVRALVKPGGKYLMTSACQGGSPSLAVLNMWLEYADFSGPLPEEHETVDQMRKAGFTDVKAFKIVPGEQFLGFIGTNPA